MRRLFHPFAFFVRAYWKDERGVTAMIMALFCTVMIGLMGLVLDFGRVYEAQRSLQATTDAAVLAGAQKIAEGWPAVQIAANKYSGAHAGDMNISPILTTTIVSAFGGPGPVPKCLRTGVYCWGTAMYPPANSVYLKEQAVVPTYFTRIAGVSSVTVTAQSTAGWRGGSGQKLNLMIVLDTTATMSVPDPACGTKATCALAGIQALLQGLPHPSLDYVGLMVFPGVASASNASNDYTCNQTMPPSDLTAYNNSPVYSIVGLDGSNNFRTSDTSAALNPNSDIVLAAGGAGCSSGVTATTYVGSFYADAITAAQAALQSFAAANTQNVIIFLSDGGANANPAQVSQATNQCQQGIAAAQAAAAAGTLVYSVAYGSSTAAGVSCPTDTSDMSVGASPPISSCTAMKDIASDSTRFYVDTMSNPTSACAGGLAQFTDLVALFKQLTDSLTGPRLITDNLQTSPDGVN